MPVEQGLRGLEDVTSCGTQVSQRVTGSGLEDIPATVGILTVKEAAELLRVSETNVYELVQTRQLPAMRVGRQIRIGRRVLVAFLHGMNADDFDALIKRRVDERE